MKKSLSAPISASFPYLFPSGILRRAWTPLKADGSDEAAQSMDDWKGQKYLFGLGWLLTPPRDIRPVYAQGQGTLSLLFLSLLFSLLFFFCSSLLFSLSVCFCLCCSVDTSCVSFSLYGTIEGRYPSLVLFCRLSASLSSLTKCIQDSFFPFFLTSSNHPLARCRSAEADARLPQRRWRRLFLLSSCRALS